MSRARTTLEGGRGRSPRVDPTTIPPEVSGDLKSLAALDPAIHEAFWEVLEPSLRPVLDDRVEAIVAKFCRSHDVTKEALSPALRACRFLLRRASQLNIERDVFRREAVAISDDEALVDAVLLPSYDRAMPVLRQRVVAGALAEHGNLLVGVDWRVDQVKACQRGRDIDTKIALLTFSYQEGEVKKRITLQLVPEMLEELRDACETILE
jgi:hypothetical protein